MADDDSTDHQAGGAGVDRRQLLAGALGLSATAALTLVFPGARPAEAAIAVRDTVQGLLAFLVPGDDRYSRHQGVATGAAGGVDAGAARFVEQTYDAALPVPLVGDGLDLDLPGALLVATLLNEKALEVDPLALVGPFPSVFANCSWDQKAEVFRRLEEESPLYDGTFVRFLLNTVPTLTGFVAYGEAPVLDPETRELTGRPVGWDLTNYPGPHEGWDEHKGYYRGVDHVG